MITCSITGGSSQSVYPVDPPLTPLAGVLFNPQAFEVVARPALDSFDSALDRLKMNIYIKFAEWGLPCPITRQAGAIGQEAASVGAGGQSQQAS